MFLVDCKHGQRNTAYGGSRSCEAAHQRARRIHAAFMSEYHLSERDFPLLRLSPDQWDQPFAALDEGYV